MAKSISESKKIVQEQIIQILKPYGVSNRVHGEVLVNMLEIISSVANSGASVFQNMITPESDGPLLSEKGNLAYVSSIDSPGRYVYNNFGNLSIEVEKSQAPAMITITRVNNVWDYNITPVFTSGRIDSIEEAAADIAGAIAQAIDSIIEIDEKKLDVEIFEDTITPIQDKLMPNKELVHLEWGLFSWTINNANNVEVGGTQDPDVNFEYGCKALVDYATFLIRAASESTKFPTAISSNDFLNVSMPDPNGVSKTMTAGPFTGTKTCILTVSAPKTGLMVNSNGSLVDASGVDSKSLTAKCTVQYRRYAGFVSGNANSVISAEIASLASVLQGGKSANVVYSNKQNKLYIYAYPKVLGLLTAINPSGSTENYIGTGFEGSPREINVTTPSGATIPYYVYVTSYAGNLTEGLTYQYK